MDFGIGRVLELLGHVVVGIGGGQLLGLAHRAGHSFGGRRQNDFGSHRLEQPSAFQAHAFRHGDRQLVASGTADKSQADSRVAAGRLDDDRVVADPAVSLGGVDHCPGNAVFDAPERVAVFHLRHDIGRASFGHFAQPDQRRVADPLGNIVIDCAGRNGCHGTTPLLFLYALGQGDALTPRFTVLGNSGQL